jgi:hypothetical protein
MVVYLYEKLSDGLHRFEVPSERDYYNGTALTQQGYFYFEPDIVFQPREPGVSVVECKRNGEEDGRESFEVWAYDFQQDKRWKNARNLSPGESGIVGEAVAAAVSMYACAKAPHVQPTIVRDEVAIDVDRVDVQTWMRILRAEAEMLNASKVLVVSHDRNVINACDTVLLVQHGQVKELEKEVRSG